MKEALFALTNEISGARTEAAKPAEPEKWTP
jgi:hypothetical protein